MNMFKIFSGLLSFVFLFSVVSEVQAQSFSDVSVSHENFEAIEQLKRFGIIKGYEDGTFQPDRTVNRAESLKIVLLGSAIEVDTSLKNNGGFWDVEEEGWYAPYVVKSKNLGIVKGNPDGSFSPTRSVNLAEILKILLVANSVSVSSSVKDSPYADVHSSEWFAPYFEYAKEKQLLDQSSTESVVPGHAMTRAEIAEIMYRLRNVLEEEARDVEFASYYSDALHGNATASGELYDKNKFTAAHKTLEFGTRVEVTNTLNNESVIVKINDRGPFVEGRVIDLSRVAFEAISPLSKGVIPVTLRVIEETSEDFQAAILGVEENCSWGSEGQEIPEDFFVNAKENIDIQLYAPMRSSYVEGEVVDVSGRVSDENIEEVTAFIKDEEGGEVVFVTEVKNGDFLVQLDLGEAGAKQISFIPGRSGSNYVAALDVKSVDCEKADLESSVLTAPQQPQFFVENNTTILRWDIGESKLSRVLIKQGNEEEVRYFSGGKKGWKVYLPAFEFFSHGEFVVRVDTAQSESGSLFDRTTLWTEGKTRTFRAVEHHFSVQDTSAIETDEISDTFGLGGEISFSGRTKTKIRPELAVITPNGTVETLGFITDAEIGQDANGVEVIGANKRFDVIYQPEEKGTYILEVNQASGVAAINVPVYEAGTVPIIPDFMDMKSVEKREPLTEVSTGAFAVEMLNLVNQERKAAFEERLELDESLSLLAQERANDMAVNNYLSHWNLDGKTANDLRLPFGINTSIGENIARDLNVQLSHLGLMRSALHRKNILDDHWERVGFGFAQGEDGGLVVVQLFSSNPIVNDDLPTLREEVLELINARREMFLVPSATLTAIGQSWSDKMANEDFFDFEDLQGVTLSEEVRKSGILQTVGTFILGNTSWIDLRDMILEHDELFNDRWEKLGVGISQDRDGIIKVTLLYSE